MLKLNTPKALIVPEYCRLQYKYLNNIIQFNPSAGFGRMLQTSNVIIISCSTQLTVK